MPTIRLVNVTKQFGKGSLAVDNLNMEIRNGVRSFRLRQDNDTENDCRS